jgi:hypothetical protein
VGSLGTTGNERLRVGALGDVLELVATSSQRWVTLTATVTQYCHQERQRRSIEMNQVSFMPKRSSPPGDPFSSVEGPVESTVVARLWARGLDHVRVEPEPSADDPASMLVVRNPSRSWSRMPNGEVITMDASGPFGGAPDATGWSMLLEPAKLLAAGDVEPLGEGAVDGRRTLRARVRSKGPDATAMFRGSGPAIYLGWMGDESIVELDAVTGLVLRFETSIGGEVFRSFTMADVTLDEPLGDDLFYEAPPAGAPTRGAHQMAEPIEVVAGRVPFALFVPAGSRCSGFVAPQRADRPQVVHIHEMLAAFRPGMVPMMTQIIESASPAGVADPSAWDVVVVGGRPASVWQPEGGGEVHVCFERDGTYIWLRGQHDRALALEIAESLVSVPPSR